MDGMNFGGPGWRPDGDEGEDAPPDAGSQTLGNLAIFALVVLATLAAIVALDRLGVPLSMSDLNAGP